MVPEENNTGLAEYPSVEEFIQRFAKSGYPGLREFLAKFQRDLYLHPGELCTVARYSLPCCHSTEHPLESSTLAIIPDNCTLVTLKRAVDNPFGVAIMQIPVVQFVTISQDGYGGEFVWRRYPGGINLTMPEIAGALRTYAYQERSFGTSECTLHIGNHATDMWLIPAHDRWRVEISATFCAAIVGATELLGMEGNTAVKALEFFFQASLPVYNSTELKNFRIRQELE